jgi:hypothetical protein
MGRIPKSLASAALFALCAGCATSGGMQHQPSSYRATLDTELIAVVESQARSGGAQVYWIHPPRKAKRAPK